MKCINWNVTIYSQLWHICYQASCSFSQVPDKDQAESAKLLDIIFDANLNFQLQVELTLKTCSQRKPEFLMKLLRDQELPSKQAECYLSLKILSKLFNAMSASGTRI